MPVASVIRSHRRSSRSNPSQLADVPFQAMMSTLACARSSAARRISLSSNWCSAVSDKAISVTLKREKCTEISAMPASIALVIGSSAVLDDGVSIPRRTGRVIMQSLMSEQRARWGGHLAPPLPCSDRQFAAVIDQGRTDQQRNAGGSEEHQRQEVGSGRLNDEADDQRRQDAGDVAAEIHAPAEESGLFATRERRGNGPIHPAPAQEKQGGGQQHHDGDRICHIGHEEDRYRSQYGG